MNEFTIAKDYHNTAGNSISGPKESFILANILQSIKVLRGRTVKFIHIADSHLGRGFALSNNSEVKDSARETWNRVVDLCIAEQADFLLIAGDSYEDNDDSLRSTVFLRDKLTQLSKAGIHSFIIHGNHDPLSSWDKNIISFEDGVTQYDNQAQLELITTKDGEQSVVAGISYAEKKQTSNSVDEIKSLFAQCNTENAFRIALLHCTVGSGNDGHDTYAPTTLDELIKCGADYIALGHVHNSPNPIRDDKPRIAYAGSLQGTSIRDTSTGGAWVISATRHEIAEARFVPLAFSHWMMAEVDISQCKNIVAVIDTTSKHIEEMMQDYCGSITKLDPSAQMPEKFIIRLTMTGKVTFIRELKESHRSVSLRELIGERLGQAVVLEKIELDVSATSKHNWQSRPQANDFLNVMIQHSRAMLNDPKQAKAELHEKLCSFLGWKSILSEDERDELANEIDWNSIINDATEDIYEQLETQSKGEDL